MIISQTMYWAECNWCEATSDDPQESELDAWASATTSGWAQYEITPKGEPSKMVLICPDCKAKANDFTRRLLVG